MLLLPDVGEAYMLNAIFKNAAIGGNQTLKLFTNNITPAEADTLATYTEMGAVNGYAAKTLTRANWTVNTAGGVTTAAYAQQAFVFTAGSAVTVYGYFVCDGATLLYAEKFASAQVVQNAGDEIRVTPQITLD